MKKPTLPLLLKCCLLAWLTVFAAEAFPQKTRGSARKAELHLRDGELRLAKAEIDAAIKKAKERALGTETKKPVGGKLYLIQGKVYQAIATSDNPTLDTLLQSPIEEAVKAFKKAMEVENESSVYALFAKQQMDQLYSQLYNKGVDAYNEGYPKKAMTHFNNLLLVAPEDTTALINIVYSAHAANQTSTVKRYAQQLIESGYTAPYLYRMLVGYAYKEKDYEKGLRLVEEAIINNPANKELKVQKVNLLIGKRDYLEAISEIKQLLFLYPTDLSLSFNLGLLYDYTQQTQEARTIYTNITEIDSVNYRAYYSLGASYYNEAADLNQQLSELDMNNKGRYINLAKAKELEKSVEELYKKAIPNFKKAYELKPQEVGNLQLLAKMYDLLDKKKEFKRIKDLLENVEE